MDTPECCICYEGLNDSTRRPRCLPCGHTICTMCIDKSIEKGDKTCPSCRQPHRAPSASTLPINYALEEIFQKLAVKSCKTSNVTDGDDMNKNTEMCDDVGETKANIICETKDFIYSIETTILELQNEIKMKENVINNHQAQLAQKLAEVECLRKDIQEENKVKHGFEGTITELEEKRRFLENSVQNIQLSKSSTDVLNIYEDIKRKLQMSTLCQDNARQKLNMNNSQSSEEYLQPRIENLVKAEGGLGLVIVGGSKVDLPIYIRTINPGTSAHRHGGLKSGDQLLSVNGLSLEGQSLKYAGELLKSTTGEMKLEVRYTPTALKDFSNCTRRFFV